MFFKKNAEIEISEYGFFVVIVLFCSRERTPLKPQVDGVKASGGGQTYPEES